MSRPAAYAIKTAILTTSFLTSFSTLTFILLRKYKDYRKVLNHEGKFTPLIYHPPALLVFLISACYSAMDIIDLAFR